MGIADIRYNERKNSHEQVHGQMRRLFLGLNPQNCANFRRDLQFSLDKKRESGSDISRASAP